jgi:DNA replication and repair protein RecF
MQLKRLEVSDFRCIAQAVLEPAADVNVIYGENGSGKTSLLEAMHVLSLGRSFRTRNPEETVRDGQQGYLLRAQVREREGRVGSLALRRLDGKASIRYDGSVVRTSAELSEKLRLSLITPDTHLEMQSMPKARRRWVDLTLFHVKPGFLDSWKRFMRSLHHRNSLLRRGSESESLDAWDVEVASLGVELHTARTEIIHQLWEVSKPLLEAIFGTDVCLSYMQGWSDDESYLSALRRHRKADLAVGSTKRGPHRADVVFGLNGKPIASRLSRGEMKLWVATLILAQAILIASLTRNKPLMLVDDLMSDLDANARRLLLQEINRSGCQLFVTTLDAASVPVSKSSVTAKFHVKHGQIKQAA